MSTSTTVKSEKIWNWFGLSYSNYLVLQRLLMQEMPDEWQEKMVVLLDELYETYSGLENAPATYTVRARDCDGKFVSDPYCQYRRPPKQTMVAIRKMTQEVLSDEI